MTATENPWNELVNKDVRGLAWAIGAPGLLESPPTMNTVTSSEYKRYGQTALPWLRELDSDPTPLESVLSRIHTWKVGLRFEQLLAFWLNHSPNYTLLGHNIQVHQDTQTLGAFDFLVQDAKGEVAHWEVALKYYLQRSASTEWSAWVGPAARDRLDLKLNRMATHQLPLSQTQAGMETLKSLGLPTEIKRRAVIKGMFFAPIKGDVSAPIHAEAGEPRGHWIHLNQAETYANAWPQSRWVNREKPYWLAPLRERSAVGMSTEEWITNMKNTPLERPVMVSRLDISEDMHWHESQRLFVVANTWPNNEAS